MEVMPIKCHFAMVLPIFVFFCPIVFSAEDSALDVFVETCRHCGENVNLIHSGYAEFDNTQIRQGMSDEKIQDMIGGFKSKINSNARSSPEYKEKEIESMTKGVSHLLSGGETKFRHRVLFTGNDLFLGLNDDCRRHRVTEQYDEEQAMWHLSDLTIFEGSPNASGLSATYLPGNRSVEVKSVLPVRCEFQRHGRMQTQNPVTAFNSLLLKMEHSERKQYIFSEKAIHQFKEEMNQKNLSFKITGTTAYDDNATATVLEIKNEDRVVERFWIDATRGYICPLIQCFDEKGGIKEEFLSKNYFLHEKTGLWYPEIYEETGIRPPFGKTTNVYHLDRETFQLNHAVSVKMFTLDIPESTKVHDKRNSNEETSYTAIEKGVLSLEKGGLDLKKMKWLMRQGDVNYQHPVSVKSPWIRRGMILAGLFMVGYALYMKFRNGRKQS